MRGIGEMLCQQHPNILAGDVTSTTITVQIQYYSEYGDISLSSKIVNPVGPLRLDS